MLKKSTAYFIFKLLWLYFLAANMADLRLHTETDLLPFIHVSEIPFVKFIPFAAAALLLIPARTFVSFFKNKESLMKLLPLFALLIVCWVSTFYAEFPETAYRTASRFSFYFIVLIAVAVSAEYFEKAPAFLIKSFVFINIFVIAGSLLDFYVPQFHKLLVNHFDRPEAKHSVMTIGSLKIMRPMGFLTDSNLTAFSIGVSMLLLLVNHKVFNRSFKYAFYAMGSYAFGMLASRASLIMCLFTIAMFFAFKFAERKELYLFTILFIVFQAATPQSYSRFMTQVDEEKIENEMIFGRPVIWKAAFEVFKDNPLVGAGPGNFFEQSRLRILDVIIQEKPGINIYDPNSKFYYQIGKGNPHNIFLVALAETGIIGLFIFVFIICIWFNYLIKKRLFISLVFFINFLFVSSLSNFAPYYKFYLVMCIILFAASGLNLLIPLKNTVNAPIK
jgi:O-Antigen ligase